MTRVVREVFMDAEAGQASVTLELTGIDAARVAEVCRFPYDPYVGVIVTISTEGLDGENLHGKAQAGEDAHNELHQGQLDLTREV